MKIFTQFSPLFSKKLSFFFLMGLFGVLFLLPTITFAATLHSTEQGGSWTQTSTWTEGTIPTENDDIEVNGYVSLPYQSEQHIKDVHIAQNGTLSSSYGVGTIYVKTIYNQGLVKQLHIHANDNIENNGEINTSVIYFSGNSLHNSGTFTRQNHSALSDIVFSGTNPKTIQGLENQDVTISLMDDLYVNETTLLPNLHTRGHIFHGNLNLYKSLGPGENTIIDGIYISI